MGKTVECSKCHSIVDMHGCKAKKEKVESGSSGGNWSFGGWGSSGTRGRRKGSGIRYNTGRSYYRTVTVYTCPDCAGWGDGETVYDKSGRSGNRRLMEEFDIDGSSSKSEPTKDFKDMGTMEKTIFVSVIGFFVIALIWAWMWSPWAAIGLFVFVLSLANS